MRWGGLISIVVVLASPAAAARAGNDDSVLLGNEAAMTGGAVVATVGDGSGAWYNPAGIAQVARSTVDVNGSAFALRIGVAPGLLSSVAGTAADGGYVEFVTIPSALTIVRDLGAGVNGAIGVFVPRFSDHTDIVNLDEPFMGGVTRWQLAETQKSSEYHLGGSLGFRIDERFRLGVSLFAVYRSYSLDTAFGGGFVLDDGTVAGAGAYVARVNLEALGAEIVAGLQWNPIDELHIGLSVLSPGVNFAARYRVVALGVTAGPGGIDFDRTDEGVLEPSLGLISPARVRLGVAYSFDGGWVSIEGDVQHPLNESDIGLTRTVVFGVRVGTRFHVDRNIALGFGLFTDLSPDPEPEEFGDTQIDFFGGTAGIELRDEHQLVENEQASTIQFSTTIALRYAVGIGRVGGLRFDTGATGADTITTVAVDTTVHEVSVHFGSALYF